MHSSVDRDRQSHQGKLDINQFQMKAVKPKLYVQFDENSSQDSPSSTQLISPNTPHVAISRVHRTTQISNVIVTPTSSQTKTHFNISQNETPSPTFEIISPTNRRNKKRDNSNCREKKKIVDKRGNNNSNQNMRREEGGWRKKKKKEEDYYRLMKKEEE
ncbi:MAG: hypothetical protein EZS28_020691 [Streblomastix strix]|uniref:Uncharacterized protein n=1 Tax=Streblomastix strix TaxID=222440 RepID=A0A5J4VMN9_9EUKA|nr:MAG: hypothetical protein EZS28_020691 [Streblomastix strix]